MLTSLTTLIVVVILYAIGGPGIHGFAFALIVGIVVGNVQFDLHRIPGVALDVQSQQGHELVVGWRCPRRFTAVTERPDCCPSAQRCPERSGQSSCQTIRDWPRAAGHCAQLHARPQLATPHPSLLPFLPPVDRHNHYNPTEVIGFLIDFVSEAEIIPVPRTDFDGVRVSSQRVRHPSCTVWLGSERLKSAARISGTKRLAMGLSVIAVGIVCALPFRHTLPDEAVAVGGFVDRSSTLDEGVPLQVPGQQAVASFSPSALRPLLVEDESSSESERQPAEEPLLVATEPPKLPDQYRPLFRPESSEQLSTGGASQPPAIGCSARTQASQAAHDSRW